MLKLKMLILTDHTNHSSENSLYPLARVLRKHSSCAHIDVATRGIKMNEPFFKKLQPENLLVSRVNEDFVFHQEGLYFEKHLSVESINDYDVVWLRLPPPLSEDFLFFLQREFPGQLFINAPSGIYETGSKEFLMNFEDLCPPIEICKSVEQIEALKNKFPIILKPLREYGGNGLIKIDGERVWEGGEEVSFREFIEK
ncbi:MAG: glutathione synthetase, partial [Bacteroidetes bacterium]